MSKEASPSREFFLSRLKYPTTQKRLRRSFNSGDHGWRFVFSFEKRKSREI
jgi:hypothetical protein